jgi:N,N-dimethylformamidase
MSESSSDRERLERSPSVLAYAETRSVLAGGTINFCVSSDSGEPYDARIVRLLAPDIGPFGPPRREVTVDAPLNGRHPGHRQPIRLGSFGHVTGPLPIGSSCGFDLLVLPTLTESDARTIVEMRTGNGSRLTLRHGGASGLEAVWSVDGSHPTTIAALPCLTERAWNRVAVTLDLEAAEITLRSTSLPGVGVIERPERTATAVFPPAQGASLSGASVAFAASFDDVGAHHAPATCFSGKLEHPRFFDTTALDAAPVAEWDFSVDIPTDRIRDLGPHHHDGVLHNMPTRAIRGAAWTSNSLTWMAEPSGYAAIHFHDTDLADAGWEPSLTYEVPHDLDSGCYALRVQPADDSTPEFYVPFFVRPAVGAARRSIAFIVPTTTYGAYANMHLRVTAQFNELAHGRLTVLDSTDFLLLRMPELGRSTYDVHRDGSPVVYSSMNRPVTNFRPTGRMYKYCLDLMIVDWLDAMGYDFDVLTEDDIDAEGVDALEPYRVVLTGSHPEYTTRPQLDAYEQYLARGGRLMYIGGNGFYSAAEVPPGRPDMVEVRRPGQDNLWRVNHAEAASSSSGLPTGLWRNIGRSENSLTGVGFLTQGFDACTHYVRSPASHDPRVAWIFDGLDPDAIIGDFGILQGGAAGYEIDRHDITKGSPPHSVVLASSGGHSNLYDLMVSSILDTLPDPSRLQDPIRADMVFFETMNGGAVFSVGSIAWTGSLSHDGYDNSVSRVTQNVLDRFSGPEPFVAPGTDA